MKHHKYFMNQAIGRSTFSNCVKLKVGAIAVRNNRPLIDGYNGTSSGATNCGDKFDPLDYDRDEHHVWSSAFEIHAEMNVICYAAKEGISLDGAILYCTHKPCNNCLKHLISVGIKEVIYKYEYNDRNNLEDRAMMLKFITVINYKAI